MTRLLSAAVLLLLATWPLRAGARQGAAAPERDPLLAGTARRDVTDREAGPVNDPLYVKALALQKGATRLTLVTVDAVALEEIGRIGAGYLPAVRAALAADPGLPPESLIVNASHCHGTVHRDIAELTIQAVREAWKRLTPVRVGEATAREERISENRRLRLKDGSEADVRRAYAMPADAEVAGIGPIDPEIGVLRLDRRDGRPLAVLYNFACHPIQGVPSGGNTADFPGFASRAIEDTLGDDTLAFFFQGCAGDLNPVQYKQAQNPRDAEPLGHRLGLGVLRAWRQARPDSEGPLRVFREKLTLPRATDFETRIAAIEKERQRLLDSLQGTHLDLKAFLPLLLQYRLDPEHPAYFSHRYLREKALGIQDLEKMDAANRADLEAYVRNIRTMEQLTRLNTNLALLRMHLKQHQAAGKPTLDVEITSFRVGDFRMVTFPGELTVETGLQLKRAARMPFTFVAGYTNGYIYYTATPEQRRNKGFAQEDCDVLIAPEWHPRFMERATALLGKLRD